MFEKSKARRKLQREIKELGAVIEADAASLATLRKEYVRLVQLQLRMDKPLADNRRI